MSAAAGMAPPMGRSPIASGDTGPARLPSTPDQIMSWRMRAPAWQLTAASLLALSSCLLLLPVAGQRDASLQERAVMMGAAAKDKLLDAITRDANRQAALQAKRAAQAPQIIPPPRYMAQALPVTAPSSLVNESAPAPAGSPSILTPGVAPAGASRTSPFAPAGVASRAAPGTLTPDNLPSPVYGSHPVERRRPATRANPTAQPVALPKMAAAVPAAAQVAQAQTPKTPETPAHQDRPARQPGVGGEPQVRISSAPGTATAISTSPASPVNQATPTASPAPTSQAPAASAPQAPHRVRAAEPVSDKEIAAARAGQIEMVHVDKAGVAKLSARSVTFKNGKTVLVGQRFDSGEKLLLVDPENGEILTSKRNLLVFGGSNGP